MPEQFDVFWQVPVPSGALHESPMARAVRSFLGMAATAGDGSSTAIATKIEKRRCMACDILQIHCWAFYSLARIAGMRRNLYKTFPQFDFNLQVQCIATLKDALKSHLTDRKERSALFLGPLPGNQSLSLEWAKGRGALARVLFLFSYCTSHCGRIL